jgi:hypothetical protein
MLSEIIFKGLGRRVSEGGRGVSTSSFSVCAPMVLMRWRESCSANTTRRRDGIAVVEKRGCDGELSACCGRCGHDCEVGCRSRVMSFREFGVVGRLCVVPVNTICLSSIDWYTCT